MNPQAVDKEFKERSRKPSSEAAAAMLARGRSIAYRKSDTPPGHVIIRHPSGQTEMVHVKMTNRANDATSK